MKSKIFYAFFIVLLLVVILGAYLVGVRIGKLRAQESFNDVLASVQVNLSFNKLERLRQIERDLNLGCNKEAFSRVQRDINTELFVLSLNYDQYKNTWVMDEVMKRDPSLASKLEQLDKKKTDAWTEPNCK